MKKHPFFSIAVPTYNRATDLEFAIFCILRQTFHDFEIVISDNCSTDDTEKIVSGFHDKRIRYSRTEKTLSNALNMRRVIKSSKGKYVFLHGDDDFLPYIDSLYVLYTEINRYKPGYVRINYVNLSSDKKRIFDFKIGKGFKRNGYVPASLSNKKILSFILDSDPYFITGIIFRNSLPRNIEIIDTDPVPWINILFYSLKNYGGFFIIKPYIIANWSRRKIKKGDEHHVFTLINGKLRCEKYLNAVRKKISSDEYAVFLHYELMRIYVEWLPVIKFKVGNKLMLQMSARMCLLDSTMKKSILYWIYFIGALLLPRFLLKIMRDISIYMYSRFSRTENDKEIVNILKDLELKYLHSRKTIHTKKDHVFNFSSRQ